MNERLQQNPSNTPIIRSLAKRFLLRLTLVVLVALFGFGLLIVMWILMSPRI